MIDDSFRFLPERASTMAGQVDMLFYCLCAFSALLSGGVAGCILYFGVKYRRRAGRVPEPTRGSVPAELAWTLTPMVIAFGLFGWGAELFVAQRTVPANAMDIYVVGRQWMWKIQHPEGRQEINELHVPLGRPIRLVMTSMDVIHDFFIPAFRNKQDVLPGSYSVIWFEASKLGDYHFFCSQYCGTNHAQMVGVVHVIEPAKYAEWLNNPGAGAELSRAAAGERLFQKFACASCHSTRAPSLAGLYGKKVTLRDGSTVLADDNYLRESILNPAAKQVSSFPSIMPTFKGQLNEEQLIDLIEYIKSLANATLPQSNRSEAGDKP
jgi:cytochrome c oxidase subunit 2